MSSRRKRWTKEEDDALRECVNLYGEKAWHQVCKFIPGRSSRQCKERWFYGVSPNIRKDEFSKDEDELLKSLVESVGTKWTQISPQFNGRTPETLKNRYYLITRKEKNEKTRKKDIEKEKRAFANKLINLVFKTFEKFESTKE